MSSDAITVDATLNVQTTLGYDPLTGRQLWEATLPFAGNATPAVYEAGGREYVVIASGGSSMNPRGPIGGVYVAFALPK